MTKNSVTRFCLVLVTMLLSHSAYSLDVISSNRQPVEAETFPSASTAAMPADSLFSTRDVLLITITADFTSLLKTKDKNDRYPAVISIKDSDADVTFPVELAIRGNFRLRHCSVPGLKVSFETDDVNGSLFAKQKKLKLVTQCKRSSAYDQYLRQEHTVYELYSALTPNSFMTRLLEVEYIDTGTKSIDWSGVGFFIEDQQRMAARLGLKVIKAPRINSSELAIKETNLLTVFQFLIGNADYSMLKGEGEENCCHNAKLIQGQAGIIPVAYDFDMTGVINADYARPPSGLGLKKVTERIYRGFCRGTIEMPITLAHLASQHEQMLGVIGSAGLSPRNTQNMTRYLDQGFRLINDPQKLERHVTKKCR